MNFKNMLMRGVAGTLELIKALNNISVVLKLKNYIWLTYIFQILAK